MEVEAARRVESVEDAGVVVMLARAVRERVARDLVEVGGPVGAGFERVS